jgi:hypothetical protein
VRLGGGNLLYCSDMRMLSARVVVPLAALALVACKKGEKAAEKKADSPAAVAPGKDPAAGSAAVPTGEPDPWSGAPTVASSMGADMGDRFATLAGQAPTAAAIPGGKVATMNDQTSIPRPKLEGQPLKGFGSIAPTGFRVVYTPSQNQVHEGLHQVLEQGRVFETLTEALNKLIRLPSQVDVQLVECGTINAFYDPNEKRVIVCYELMTYFAQIFQPTMPDENQLGMAVIGATTFAFFHEIGHGLIHLLDLPAVGREEDSADQLATLILIADGDDGVGLALSGAHWFQLQEKAGTNQTPFSDEHAFDMQRFYNIVCMIYGSNPQKYADFVSSGALPEARAARCPEEYAKIAKAWEKLLQPHLTNAAAENVDYQPSVPLAEAPSNPTWDNHTTPPAQPTAPSAEITCEQVAQQALMLIGAEAVKRAESMTPAEVEELKTQLETQLPAIAEQLLAECAKDDWPQKDRRCVLDAQTLDAASKCGM